MFFHLVCVLIIVIDNLDTGRNFNVPVNSPSSKCYYNA